ncbi:hypothetical protein F4820DRAFT_409074 [Hypoxylon rubiginosum]|uniref:Uncharacterized protein n=1 Tax=Hypoxylon rubiginosum TaxID=110542 RepID=A0ACB9ZB17_9PEZI|nr:hypothetical protein F4820DRAFT_409074 [Hypoxylon rubiginosum]
MSLNKCAVCWKEGGKACVACKSCCYCSKECQKSDWKSHKLLCHAIANEEARPTPSHVRAIYFPEDKPTPELVWIHHTPEDEVNSDPGILEMSLMRKLLTRNANDLLGLTKISWNHRLKQHSSRMIEFHYRDNFCNDGSHTTASINATVEPHGPEKRHWKGPVLVLAISREEPPDDDDDGDLLGGPILQYTDATLADFRSVIDHSLCYERQQMPSDMQALLSKFGFKGLDLGDGTPPPAATEGVSKDDQRKGSSGGNKSSTTATTSAAPDSSNDVRETIQGVQLDCQEKGSDVRQVRVPRNHPIRNGDGDISPISRLVGMPLRLRKNAERFADWGNQKACWMMLNINIDDPTWGFAPFEWQIDINNVIVVKEDGQDLSFIETMNFFAFCADFLDQVEHAAEIGTRQAKVEAMTFLTPENYQKKLKEYK